MSCTLFVFFARAESDIEQFIKTVSAPSYDCPVPDLIPRLNELLANDELTPLQKYRLSVEQTQHQICIGSLAQAKNSLLSLTQSEYTDRSSDYYADAIYQLAFIYDVSSKVFEACKHYKEAIELANGKYNDIYVSANLGYITECETFTVQEKLRKIYALLDDYSTNRNNGLLAHIHNSLGFVYSEEKFYHLAAEQFLKAHNLGVGVYNGSNRLSILTSAINAYTSSEQYDLAENLLLDYEEINKEVDTLYTNFIYLFSKSRIYAKQEKFAQLKATLDAWKRLDSGIENKIWNAYYKWHEGIWCLHLNDQVCLRALFNDEILDDSGVEKHLRFSSEWNTFKIKAGLALNDLELTKEAINDYFYIEKIVSSEKVKYSNSINITELYGKIQELESKVAFEKKLVSYFGYFAVFGVISVSLIGYILFKRRLIKQREIDPITGLYSPESVVSKISKLQAPAANKAHAIAIFDLANFRDLNRLMGVDKSDLILKEVASTLSTVTREHDILGRLAPEQFILCLTNIEEATAKSFLERVRKALERTFLGGQHGVDANLNSSMSIFIATEKLDDVQTILEDMLVSFTIK
ncbi:GGDEF domain-containing protein [Agaribacter flavus]|uniref:GGDEF domain-containing protein n=1 Tax=Agaribacter flavus TaxID=1902781 RepID=UPI003671F6C6